VAWLISGDARQCRHKRSDRRADADVCVSADAERQARKLRPERLGAAGEDDRPVGTWLGVIAGQHKITGPSPGH
jgi:hypothetical protein